MITALIERLRATSATKSTRWIEFIEPRKTWASRVFGGYVLKRAGRALQLFWDERWEWRGFSALKEGGEIRGGGH